MTSFLILIAAMLGGLALLMSWSRGTPAPFVDANGTVLPGSIAEKIYVPINGVDQGMVIKSVDQTHPVLLYLHGGMPDYFLTQDYPTGLDQHFTVVWWEQRGSGMSYWPDTPLETITPAQLIADTLAVTQYLQNRFGQELIYLMGHSGGTFLGLQVAAQASENYHAYIAIAQITDQLASERLAYDYMLAQFRAQGDAPMVRRMQAAPPPQTVPLSDAYMGLRDVAMHKLGVGTMRQMRSVVRDLFLRSLQFRDYTLAEKIRLWRGKIVAGAALWNTVLRTDLTTQITTLELPVYFLHGALDYTVSYPLARRYFDQLEAPRKGFYTFAEAAHSPLFEDPQRLGEIMVNDVLAGGIASADPVGAQSLDE